MARKQFLINYHTSGVTNPLSGDVKMGEIVVKHNNEKPSLVTLKNNGEWAEFIDEKAIDTKLSAVTVDLTGQIEGVAGDVETLSSNVDTKFADYATSANTEAAISVAKDAAIGAASAYTDEQVASAVTVLRKDAELAANGVEALSGNVVTLIGDDSGKTVRKIANEELAAQLLSGEADADFKTLQELAAWLEDHPESVGEINTNIASLSAATGTLHTNIEKVAEDVETLSGNVDTKFADYATSANTEAAISAAKDAAIGAASAYTDEQVASAVTVLNKAVEGVADNVETLSDNVDTKFADYATSANTEAAISTAKDAAIGAASAYTDEQVASAETQLRKEIEAASDRIEELEKLSGATESAIQVIAVSGIEGVEVVESGTTRTIDFDGMIIDGGEY